MKEQQISILYPVAALYSATCELSAVRFVRCYVQCTDLMLCRSSNKTRDLLVYEIQHIVISKLLSYEVKEISLTDFKTDIGLRNRLVLLVRNYDVDKLEIRLRGTCAVPTVYASGQVVNPCIYQPVLSFRRMEVAAGAGRSRQLADIRLHGFFDYTGAWHMGTTDLPNREPFVTELRKLSSMPFILTKIPEALPETMLANMFVACNKDMMLSKRVYTPLPLVKPTVTVMTQEAAQYLMQDVRGLVSQDDFTLYYVDEGNATLRLHMPWIAQKLRCTLFADLFPEALEKLKSAIIVQMSPNAKQVQISTDCNVLLQGMQSLILQEYIIDSADNLCVTWPREFARNLLYERVELRMLLGQHVTTDTPTKFNLAARCTTMKNMQIETAVQLWDAVTLPIAKFGTRFASCVTRAQFALRLAPCIDSSMYKTNTFAKQENGLYINYEFAVRIGLVYRQNEVQHKHSLLDLREIKNWWHVDISVTTEADSAGYYDATNHVTEVLLGGTNVNVQLASGSQINRKVVFTYCTDCTVTDRIIAQGEISDMICYIRSTKIPMGIVNLGAMHIKADIDKLVIVLLDKGNTTEIKHIYIDGNVREIAVYRGIRGVTECEENYVRVHLRKDTTPPRVNKTNVPIRNGIDASRMNDFLRIRIHYCYNKEDDRLWSAEQVQNIIDYK